MSYLAVYRALVLPPEKKAVIARGSGYSVSLDPGPLSIPYQSAHAAPELPHAALDIQYEKREFPRGSYALVQVRPPTAPATTDAGWGAAIDRFSQVAAALDLDFPGILHEKIYEGTVSTRANPLFIDAPGGLRFAARGYRLEDVRAALQPRLDQMTRLPDAAVSRLALASRWFRRANDSTSPIDRVLFYYTVLEVVRGTKKSEVPKAVATFLSKGVYPELSASELKRRLNLGRICGFRGQIVHGGKAEATTIAEWIAVNDHVERLQAISRTCLRLLMGLDPGRELDRYVLEREVVRV